MKTILTFYLFIHITISVLTNLNALTNFKGLKYKGYFNSFGSEIISIIHPVKIPFYIKSYRVYSGINRGYGFFSPNVNALKYDYKYILNNNEIYPPIKTIQGKMRINVFMTNVQELLNEKEKENTYRNIFRVYNNKSVTENFTILLKITKYKRISEINSGVSFKETNNVNIYEVK